MSKNKILLFFLLLGVTLSLKAEVKLPKIFSSNMVLQQGMEIPIWGTANKGERIRVSFNGKVIRAIADKNGKWKLYLPKQEYGGPYQLTIKGKNTIVLDNVMIGEVWVCSGQSNMEFQTYKAQNAEKEIATAQNADIRLFSVKKRVAQFPEKDLAEGSWQKCSPETVNDFSAVGYFFGRTLYQKLHVAIGLIHTSWGGTVAETWTSEQTIENDPDFKELLAELQEIDVDNYNQAIRDKIKELLGGEIPKVDKGIQNGKALWAAPEFDDSNWKTIETPGLWEGAGYRNIDGIAWYRKELFLSEKQANNSIKLHLCRIDDSDITFFNGHKVGENINQYDKDRIYVVDSKYLKPGKNTIAVRVEDTGGGGGIYGLADELYIETKDGKINISGDWKFKISKVITQAVGLKPNSYPTLLYNGMINPLVPFGIKGVIWYQGEANAERAHQYQRIFPNMINDWRQHWGQGNFPFLFVSLANYMQPVDVPKESQWAELREAQTMTLKLPNTGMALAIDIGEANDIHPRNKQEVGRRLALNAFKVAYNMNVVNLGPMYKSVAFKNGKAYITFADTGAGLTVKDKYGYLKAFTIAGADKKFYWAKAEIVDNNTVVVYSKDVSKPVAVRFGWADNPDDLNLYNKEGLPATPFRTDNWQGITK